MEKIGALFKPQKIVKGWTKSNTLEKLLISKPSKKAKRVKPNETVSQQLFPFFSSNPLSLQTYQYPQSQLITTNQT